MKYLIGLCVIGCNFILINALSDKLTLNVNPATKYTSVHDASNSCPPPECECSCSCKAPVGPKIEPCGTTSKPPTPPLKKLDCPNGGTLPDCCANGGKGQYCCTNGANNKDCCTNGGKGKYCCLNGANNADCCANGGKGKFCCTNGANNEDCCANGGKGKDCCTNGGKGKYCCLNGANNQDCCANGGKGKYCCTNGANNERCEIPTKPSLRSTTPPPTYIPPITIVQKDEDVTLPPRTTTTTRKPIPRTTKFRGPTYLPPTKPYVSRPTTSSRPSGPRGTFTYGTYSIPKFTFSYTYPTNVPTKSRKQGGGERKTFTYTTTEGYERRREDKAVKDALKF